jgi:hypothetical protein
MFLRVLAGRAFAARHRSDAVGLILAWQRYQLDLAAKFPESRFQVAANSGQMIPVDEPELLVSEIRSMIAAVVT